MLAWDGDELPQEVLDLARRMAELGGRMEALRDEYRRHQEYELSLFGDEFRVAEA